MTKVSQKLEYNCIFGGGAIRGLSYIGALQALDELGIKINTLVGSSVGAIIAGLIAVGYKTEEIKKILLDVNFELFKDIQFGKSFGISKGEVFLEWIQELLEKKFYGEKYQKGKNTPIRFSDLKKNLIIITTNLASFDCKEFSKLKTPEAEVAYAIRISCTMPGLMPPVKASGAVLVDGDLQKSWPLWKLVSELENQTDRILEFRLEGDFDIEKHGGINFVNTVYSCVTSIATKFIVDKYAQKDKFDYIVINTGSTIIVDFSINEEKRNKLIKMGYDQTINYFKTTLKTKKAKILEYYIPIGLMLKKLEILIKNKKLSEAELELGSFYMKYIQGISLYIDKKFIKDLNNLKDLFFENYTHTKFLKTPKLLNSKIILHRISKIKDNIDSRIKELEEYCKS